ncbi:hypothetical protein Droror1_Dr00000346, partial [Drosera rotundifolia]
MGGKKCSSLSDMVKRATGVEKGLRLQKSMSFKRPRETFHYSQGRKGDWKRRPTQAPTQRPRLKLSRGHRVVCQRSHGSHERDAMFPTLTVCAVMERARHETFAQRPTTLAASGQRPAAVQRFGNQAKGKE